jgi:hypothetical protein
MKSCARERSFQARLVAGVSVPFDAIGAPGAYVCNWSGHLLRVPEGAAGRALGLNIVGHEPLTVTKISDDPQVSLTDARHLAAGLGVTAGF